MHISKWTSKAGEAVTLCLLEGLPRISELMSVEPSSKDSLESLEMLSRAWRCPLPTALKAKDIQEFASAFELPKYQRTRLNAILQKKKKKEKNSSLYWHGAFLKNVYVCVCVSPHTCAVPAEVGRWHPNPCNYSHCCNLPNTGVRSWALCSAGAASAEPALQPPWHADF